MCNSSDSRTLRSSFIITLSPAADCAPQRALPRSHWTCARPCPTPPGEQQQTPTPEGPLWIPHGFSPGRTQVSTATLWIFDCVEGISSGPVNRAAADVSPSFCRKSRIPLALRSPGKSKGRQGPETIGSTHGEGTRGPAEIIHPPSDLPSEADSLRSSSCSRRRGTW